MHLKISKEVERSIQQRAHDAGFGTVEEYLLELVAQDESSPETCQQNWLSKFDAFVARQTSRNPNFDDRRETLYPVR